MWTALALVATLCSSNPARDGVAFESLTWPQALERAAADESLVLLYLYDHQSDWCDVLESRTLSHDHVGAATRSLVCVKFDSEEADIRPLAHRYHAQLLPLMVITDAKGDEIDRIGGFLPPDAFLAELVRVISGRETLPRLRQAWLDNPDDPDATLDYAAKLVAGPNPALGRQLIEQANERWRGVDFDLSLRLDAELAFLNWWDDDNRRALKGFDHVIDSAPTSEIAERCYAPALLAHRDAGNIQRALQLAVLAEQNVHTPRHRSRVLEISIDLYRDALLNSLQQRALLAEGDAEALNELAWQAYRGRIGRESAIAWSERAVELSNRDPNHLDTLAHLLAEPPSFADGGAPTRHDLGRAVALAQEAANRTKDPFARSRYSQVVTRLRALQTQLDDAAKASTAR